MAVEIPFDSTPSRSFVTQLGRSKYRFETRFNDRSGVWTMDLTDATTSVPMVRSVPLVLGCDLLEPYPFGIGSIIVIDTANQGREAGAADLGDRVRVYWLSPDEAAL